MKTKTETDTAAPAETITEAIAAHLAANCSSAVLEMIRGRAQAELDAKRTEEASFREQSIDPRLTVEQARAKRDEAEDAAHEARRIAAAIDAIDERLPALKAAEHRERIMPDYLAFKAERAEFAERLGDRWPKLSAEMLELLRGIDRFDGTPPCEIPDGEDPLRESVEAIARGLPPGFYGSPGGGLPSQPLIRLRQARIPSFHGGSQYDWTERSAAAPAVPRSLPGKWVSVKNTQESDRGINTVAGLRDIAPGETIEVEMTDAEIASADRSGWFEIGTASRKEA